MTVAPRGRESGVSEKPVRLLITDSWGERWLRTALNAMPSREEQLCVVLCCFQDFAEHSPVDGCRNEAKSLLHVLSDLAVPDYDSFYKDGQPIKGKSAAHFTCAQNLLFRKWLRENVYPVVANRTSLILDILQGIIQGWSLERAEIDDRGAVYHDDAEECFWFICKAYAEFPSPAGDVLRGKIEDMIRVHLESGGKPIPGLLLCAWIARRGVPDGIARKMLHALVNLQPIEDSKSKLGS